MQKNKMKFIITLFTISIILFSTFCFATNSNDIMLISEDTANNSKQESTTYSDLYISENNDYTIKNTIAGNVFGKVDSFNLGSDTNSGIITGNLFVLADTVNINSTFKYSETNKDDLGNPKLESVTNASKVEGNVFVAAEKFVLDPKCEINGDLYIYANEIKLSQNAIIRGNVFVIGDRFDFNSEINAGDLYANVKDFNMGYYGFVYRDLHLSAKNATISGSIYRSSFISSDKITTTSTFINNKDFNIESSLDTTFSGTIKGNANINSKNITFKSKDDTNKNVTCLISGDLNYSSKNEIKIEDKIVSGNVNYSEYKSYNNLLSNIGDYLLGLLTSLVYIIIIYLGLNKFAPKFIEKVSNLNVAGILKFLGFGILLFVALPVLSILLFVTTVGSLLGLLIAIIYALLLIVAKPIVVISISKLINRKVKSINIYVAIIITTIALSLINLIPYVGFIVALLVIVLGLGLIVKFTK